MKLSRIFLLLAITMTAVGSAATPTCTATTSGVAFGNYNPISGANADSTGTVTVTCSGAFGEAVVYTVSLGTGSGKYTNRTMANGSTLLGYNLYTNPPRTQVWGDGTTGTAVVNDSFTIRNRPVTNNYTIYGRIPSGQAQATVGAYNDQVIVTVTY